MSSPDDKRRTLYGRPASDEDIAREVARLYLGNSAKHQEAQNPTQIAKTLGYKQPKSVYNYMNLAADLGLLKKITITNKKGQTKTRYEKPEVTAITQFERMDSDKFANQPLVKEWVENMLTKKNGKPIKTWRTRFMALKNFCNTFKLKPEQLIIDKKIFLQILTSCKIEWDKGISYDAEHKYQITSNTESSFHFMKMACRDFVQFHGIALPKNIGGIASGKVINHGKYADIRLSLDEIEAGEKFIEEKYGIDSDVMRLFSVGVCTGARAGALYGMNCEWSEIPSPMKPEVIEKLKLSDKVFVMKAYETKTETKWTKYIIRPRAQQSLVLHKEKNQFQKIISHKDTLDYVKSLADQLREVWKFLGKEFVHDGYFMRKPFHTLRHIAPQWWIEISNGNLSLVCDTCGWKSDIELKASYGEISPEMRLKSLGALGA